MSKHKPLVPCPTCGVGQVPLHDDMLRTLERVRKSKKPVSTSDLLEERVGSTAINQRLVRLESYGLIERVGKNGRFILWKAVKP